MLLVSVVLNAGLWFTLPSSPSCFGSVALSAMAVSDAECPPLSPTPGSQCLLCCSSYSHFHRLIQLKGHCVPSAPLSTSTSAHRAREKPLEGRWHFCNPDSMVRGSSGRGNALVNPGWVWLPCVHSSSFQTLPSHTAMLQPRKRSRKRHRGPLMWRQ